jgi:hypothetical protein
VITDVVRANVASEQFVLRRRTRQHDGTVTYRPAGAPVVRSLPLPRSAAGEKGASLRFVTLARPYAVEYNRVIARDARGRVLRSCGQRACTRLAAHDR